MAFARPTLKELIERIRGDIRSELGIAAIVRRSFLGAIARAVAGAAHSLHGHLKEISKQAFPDQATGIFLKRWGSIYGIPQKPATFTQLQITGTGINGSLLPQFTVFVIDNGETYETDDDVTVAGGVYTVNVTAINAGAQTNLADGETMNLQSPVAGIDSEAVVADTLLEGEDVENEEDQQARIVQRIQEPPAGGKVTDYIQWALEISGVTRAWVFPGNRGQGTVDVSFVEDNDSPIIPDAPKVAEVQAHIDVEKPVTADSVVFAPVAFTIDFTIKIKPNTAAVQAAVIAELQDLFMREGDVAGAIDPENIAAAEILDGVIEVSKINEAISLASGEDDHEIVLPVGDIVPTQGQIAVLGTVTFQTLV